MDDRIAYTGTTDTFEFREHYYSGRLIYEDGSWWLAQYHVAYAQSGVDTANNFTCRAKAEAKFEERLADLRKSWGHKGARFTEERTGDRIRFRSILKNGKPGKLTGILYMHDMSNVTSRINQKSA